MTSISLETSFYRPGEIHLNEPDPHVQVFAIHCMSHYLSAAYFFHADSKEGLGPGSGTALCTAGSDRVLHLELD